MGPLEPRSRRGASPHDRGRGIRGRHPPTRRGLRQASAEPRAPARGPGGYNRAMTPRRSAAFVAVGSELLRTDRLDTNSLMVRRLLAPCGFALVEKRCVEDDELAIAAAVAE